MSDYTQTPDKLRIVRDEVLTDPEPGSGPDLIWQLDGIDTRTAYTDPATGLTRYDYTEQVWNFATHAEAVAAIPDFIGHLSEYLPEVAEAVAEAEEGAELSDSLEWAEVGAGRVADSQSWATGAWSIIRTLYRHPNGALLDAGTWTARLIRPHADDWILGENYPDPMAAQRAAQAEEDRGAPSCGCGATHWSCPA